MILVYILLLFSHQSVGHDIEVSDTLVETSGEVITKEKIQDFVENNLLKELNMSSLCPNNNQTNTEDENMGFVAAFSKVSIKNEEIIFILLQPLQSLLFSCLRLETRHSSLLPSSPWPTTRCSCSSPPWPPSTSWLSCLLSWAGSSQPSFQERWKTTSFLCF